MINIITAIGKNNELGKSNDLLWNFPEDLQHFKEVTTNSTCIMGRKTFESIIKRNPNGLTNRDMIVISSKANVINEVYSDNPNIVSITLEGLNSTIDTFFQKRTCFVIGGAKLYDYFLTKHIDKVSNLYLTRVDNEYPEADTFFPKVIEDLECFQLSRTESGVDSQLLYETWINNKLNPNFIK